MEAGGQAGRHSYRVRSLLRTQLLAAPGQRNCKIYRLEPVPCDIPTAGVLVTRIRCKSRQYRAAGGNGEPSLPSP